MANSHGAGHPSLENYPERFRNRQRRLASTLKDQCSDGSCSSEGTVGYWPGCDAIDKSMDDVFAAVDLLSSVGKSDVQIVESDEICGGYPLLAAGYPDMFRWHASKVVRSLSGFQTIVTNCSACLYTMRNQYRAEGLELAPTVLSLAEYLAQKISALPRSEERPRIHYHDPCHLARYCGVLEEPRQILATIADVRDFDWSHEEAECCGGAGLLPKTAPSTADSMARRRLREIAARGGGTVVTSCATCAFMLKSNAPSGVKVYDLPGYLMSRSSQ
jgi:Fe-S oxidoreductase